MAESREIRYVSVPVPREYVLDVMRWVLFRAPEESSEELGRDEKRLRKLLGDMSELHKALVLRVAAAAVVDEPLPLRDAADELDITVAEVSRIVYQVNSVAFTGGRPLVRIRSETAVGVAGQVGRASFLVMRPDHAHLVRSVAKASDAASG